MIFHRDVSLILSGGVSESRVDNLIEHYTLGGFHADVNPDQRREFAAWMAAWMAARDARLMRRRAEPEQLDLLQSAAHNINQQPAGSPSA